MGAVSVGTAPIVCHDYYNTFTLTTESFQSKIIAEIIITLAALLDVNCRRMMSRWFNSKPEVPSSHADAFCRRDLFLIRQRLLIIRD